MNIKNLGLGLIGGGAIVALLAGLNLAGIEQEKRISALGDAAFLDDCELQDLGKMFGFTPKRSTLFGGEPQDCSAPDPLDTQASFATGILWLGLLTCGAGGAVVLFARNPEKFSQLAKVRPHRLSNSKSGESLADKLRELDNLKKEGLLTQEEFDQQKKKLLS